MVKTGKEFRETSEMNKIIKLLMQKDAEAKEAKEAKRVLDIAKNELEQDVIEAKLEQINIWMDQIRKWQRSEGANLKLQFYLQTGEFKKLHMS